MDDKRSLNPVQEKIQQLKELMPEVFTEGKVDLEKFQILLGQRRSFDQERYGLNWTGKSEAIRILQQTISARLVPVREESIHFEQTKHILIEGENLEVLKVLQKAYFSKVKMIYIDPPYNTGNDNYIYPDRFAEGKKDFRKRVYEGDGRESILKEERSLKNSQESGRVHSNWLSMMYPRLYLARNMLREDGVIFVSIDDNEVHNLRLLIHEIFGEENFIANVIWEKKYTRANDARWFSDNHDHILVAAKNKDLCQFNLLARTDKQLSHYSNPDNHPKGPWKATPLHAKSGTVNCFSYTFKNGVVWSPPPGTYPRFSRETLQRLEEGAEIWFGQDNKAIPARKTFLAEVKAGVTPTTIWTHEDVGHNHEATNELKALFPDNPFTNPKPTRLIKRMLQLVTGPGDIVLDFFAGSATTAHAVLAQNCEDGFDRRFICIQLAEPTHIPEYPTIADIAKERIRRVIRGLEKDSQTKNFKRNCDLGFKVFKLRY